MVELDLDLEKIVTKLNLLPLESQWYILYEFEKSALVSLGQPLQITCPLIDILPTRMHSGIVFSKIQTEY